MKHLEEVDDTPGAERWSRYHPAGTFEEWGPKGQVSKGSASEFKAVDGPAQESTGPQVSHVAGDRRSETTGAEIEKVHGPSTKESGTTVRIVQGDMTIEVRGESVEVATAKIMRIFGTLMLSTMEFNAAAIGGMRLVAGTTFEAAAVGGAVLKAGPGLAGVSATKLEATPTGVLLGSGLDLSKQTLATQGGLTAALDVVQDLLSALLALAPTVALAPVAAAAAAAVPRLVALKVAIAAGTAASSGGGGLDPAAAVQALAAAAGAGVSIPVTVVTKAD